MTNAVAEMAVAPADERRAPEIHPDNVTEDHYGNVRRKLVVRLPQGFIAADLSATGCWKKVQQSRLKALRRHDELYLIAYDESWVAEALVSDSNASEVSLSKPVITKMESRIKPLLNDGTYRVEWQGTGYVVVRNKDNQPMTNPVASLPIAERELAQQYPRSVA